MWDDSNIPPRVGVVATMAARNNDTVRETEIRVGGEWDMSNVYSTYKDEEM